MAFQARDVIRKAQIILQDAGGVRWPPNELLGWLNDAMREVALQKPTATSETVIVSLGLGTKQSLPQGYHKLLSAIRNVSNGRVITPIMREVLDSQIPGWHSEQGLPFSPTVMHIIDDIFDQSVFYVAPGNDGSGQIELILSRIPDPISVPNNPLDIDLYVDEVPMPPVYQNCLMDYICYRAFSKDINLAGAAQRAQAHYGLFQQALGLKSQIEMAQNVDTPKSRFSQ